MKKRRYFRWQAVTSTISTTMVLILLGVLIMFVLTARQLRDSVREDLTLTIVLSDGTSTLQAHALEDIISRRSYIRSIDFISSEQALEEQVKTLGIDPSEFLGGNPFSISMELHLKSDYACTDSLRWITKQLGRDKNVVDVIYQKEMIDTLDTNLRNITYILLTITVLLCIVCLSLINNTVRLSIYSRRWIINTMKLVGARWSFIRRPFMLRSLAIGLIAAALADAMIYAGIRWMQDFDPTIVRFMPMENTLITLVSVVAFSIIITQLCTFISVTHFIRMRESELYK